MRWSLSPGFLSVMLLAVGCARGHIVYATGDGGGGTEIGGTGGGGGTGGTGGRDGSAGAGGSSGAGGTRADASPDRTIDMPPVTPPADPRPDAAGGSGGSIGLDAAGGTIGMDTAQPFEFPTFEAAPPAQDRPPVGIAPCPSVGSTCKFGSPRVDDCCGGGIHFSACYCGAKPGTSEGAWMCTGAKGTCS